MKGGTAKILRRGLWAGLAVLFFYPYGYFVLGKGQKPLHNRVDSSVKGAGAYILNLDRCPERYSYIEPQVAQLGLPFQRIAGVDGKKLSQATILEVVDTTTYQNLLGHLPKYGTIGCSLSHIKAWKAFLESDFEFAVIFEDDAAFDPAQLVQAIGQLIQHPAYWDIVNLESFHHGVPLTIRRLEGKNRLVVYLSDVSHTGAYILNRHAAEKLLAYALPIKLPVDHYFSRGWELGLKFTGLEPRLVSQQCTPSVIQESAAITDTKSPFSLSTRGLKVLYKFQSCIIRFAYNLKLYLTMKAYPSLSSAP